MRADPFYFTSAWRALRRLALQRDGWCCTHCGANVSLPGTSRIDHIQPRRTHPHLALSLTNLRTLCLPCDNKAHAEKGVPRNRRPHARIDNLRRGVDADGWPRQA